MYLLNKFICILSFCNKRYLWHNKKYPRFDKYILFFGKLACKNKFDSIKIMLIFAANMFNTLIFSIMKNTTTTTTAAKVMDAAAIVTAAAALVRKYGSICSIEDHRAALREKYGVNWSAIRKECKEIRQKDIAAALVSVRRDVFSYRGVLGAQFKALAAHKDYKKLCKFAKAVYKGTDTDTAAALVRDWYTHIDTTTGAPLVLVSYIDTTDKAAAAGLIYTAYQPAKLDGRAALVVLQKALDNIAAAAKKSARKGTDTAPADKPANKRAAARIVDVFESEIAAKDCYKRAAALTGAHATTDKAKAKAVTTAAALIGRSLPASVMLLSEFNAICRAAYDKAAAAALVEKQSALVKDAAAAGVKTTAPAKRTSKATKDTAAAAA